MKGKLTLGGQVERGQGLQEPLPLQPPEGVAEAEDIQKAGEKRPSLAGSISGRDMRNIHLVFLGLSLMCDKKIKHLKLTSAMFPG